MTGRSIDEIIADTEADEIAADEAVRRGEPCKLLAQTRRVEARAARRWKKELVQRGKDIVASRPVDERAVAQAVVDELMPDTPGPLKPKPAPQGAQAQGRR